MKVIIISKKDMASCNILDKLLDLENWEPRGEFFEDTVYYHDDFCIATIADEHIFHDNVDLEIEKKLGFSPGCIIYASRHRSGSGNRSLTVHPIGNFSKAEFGGISKELVLTSPHLMTQAVRLLKKKAQMLDFSVSFEATHHGPDLKTPTFFIEIGSDENAWRDEQAAEAIARTLMEIDTRDYPVAIGVGGGHYAPRISDLVLERKISMGHIVPTYALENIDREMAEKLIRKTPGVQCVYFHKKRIKGGELSRLKALFSDLGLEIVKSSEMQLLDD